MSASHWVRPSASAPDVAAAVVAESRKRFSARDLSFDVLEPLVLDTCLLATVLIGRYLAQGEGATAAERDYLAERSTTAVIEKKVLKDVTKNYLTWRDKTLLAVREEAVRLGSGRALTAEVGCRSAWAVLSRPPVTTRGGSSRAPTRPCTTPSGHRA